MRRIDHCVLIAAIGLFLFEWPAHVRAQTIYAFASHQVRVLPDLPSVPDLSMLAFTHPVSSSANIQSIPFDPRQPAVAGPGSGVAFAGLFDAAQAYIGQQGTAPPENDFAAKGLTNASYARGDVRGSGFTHQSVAESYLAATPEQGNVIGFGSGNWSLVGDLLIGVATPWPFSMNVFASTALDLRAANVLVSSLAQASFSFAASIVDSVGHQVFSWAPEQLNQTHSLNSFLTETEDATFSARYSESTTNAVLASPTVLLSPGEYTLTITGGTTVHAVAAVPEPASFVLIGLGVLGGLGIRRMAGRRLLPLART